MVALIDGLSKGNNERLKYKVMFHVLAVLAAVVGHTGHGVGPSWPVSRRLSTPEYYMTERLFGYGFYVRVTRCPFQGTLSPKLPWYTWM